MNPLTLEWIEKAEGDFVTAGRELRARIAPNFDASCFHAQQMAEKYLKAVLQENNQPIPRTHNLIDLLAQCLTIDASFNLIRSDLIQLDRFAVRFRYPGEKRIGKKQKQLIDLPRLQDNLFALDSDYPRNSARNFL